MAKLMFFNPAHCLPLACFEASRAWFSQEKQCVEALERSDQLETKDFKSFLKVWGVARTAPITTRTKLAERLAEITKHYQVCDDIDFERFEADVESLYDDGLTTGRPYSLVSKYLFCKDPSEFSPYDKHASCGLNISTGPGRSVDYAAFLEAFENFHAKLRKDLEKRSLTRDLFVFDGKKFDDEQLFSRRVADKYLMLRGGFGEYRMAGFVNASKDKFPTDTVTRFS